MGPYLETRIPLGTFLTIWVHKESLFLSKVPTFPVLGSCTRLIHLIHLIYLLHLIHLINLIHLITYFAWFTFFT